MNSTEQYTLEYSASQNCFHIDTLSRVLEMNIMNCLSRNSVDYQILGLYDSYEKAEADLREFRRKNGI